MKQTVDFKELTWKKETEKERRYRKRIAYEDLFRENELIRRKLKDAHERNHRYFRTGHRDRSL